MKKFKKLTSLLLAMVMIIAMTMTAYADEAYTITISNDKAGHNYVAYQILSGDLAVEGEDTILSNIKWAAGQKTHETGTDAADAFDGKSASAIKAIVEELELNAEEGKAAAFADGKYVISGLEAGYYLVKDEKAGSNLGNSDAFSSSIIQVVGNVTVEPKAAAPTVDKQVWDEAEDGENGQSWGETADHSINESFQFKLIGKIAGNENYAAYDHYRVVFYDTMSKGITFESVESVKVGNTEITDYEVTGAETGTKGAATWKLTIKDLLDYGVDLTAGAEIEVIYNAHLNEEAAIGNLPENHNTVTLKYSNNPNISEDEDGAFGEEDFEENMGTTKEDTVWVFTYQTLNTKVDGSNDNAPLANVEFKLFAGEGENASEVALIYDETVNAYRPVKGEEAAENMKSAEDGKFNIVGLDAGTYTLKEVAPLPGYNACEDIVIAITAVHSENEDGSSAATTIKYNGAEENSFTIVNEKGLTLPSTGGMGTTIFYVIGSLLVIGSAVVLVTRKRMSR